MIRKERPQQPLLSREGQWQGKKVQYYANRIIVKFKPGLEKTDRSAEDIVETVRRAIPNGVLLRRPRATGRALFGVDSAADIIKLAQSLAKHPDVEYAEPDIIDKAQVIPTDTRYADQWALPKISAPAAWDLETGSSSGVLIGIIDSGISMSTGGALDHPDLNDATRYILGTDFVDGGTPRDLCGHGTHVAGIAAAESDNAQGVCGINWATRVYICRTLDANGNGGSADFADAVEEIVDYAVAQNLKAVINYSAGGGANQTKWDACKYASDHGMIICAATGNDYGGSVIYPAAYSTMFDAVIAVGSTNSDDTISDFSNVGPEVTVVAPGRDILSAMPTYPVTLPGALNYDYQDGTSMATPLVTGLVALMWSRHPGFTNKRIRECLTGTAKKLGAGTFDNTWGYGRIEAEKALRCGDIIFTHFTHITKFTWFTSFTAITKFTWLTRFTHITKFTWLTPFTHLTLFTRLTRFTPFTIFQKYTRPPGPGPERPPEPVRPFIRIGNTVFAPEELRLERFEQLGEVVMKLREGGIETLDELATRDTGEIAGIAGLTNEDATRLVELAQTMIRRLAEES